MTGGTEETGFAPETVSTGGLTLTSLARQWRGEADAHDPGEISLYASKDGVERRAYAKALRDCAGELDSVAATRVIVSRDDLQYVLAHVADEIHGHPDPAHWSLPLFREALARLAAAAEAGK